MWKQAKIRIGLVLGGVLFFVYRVERELDREEEKERIRGGLGLGLELYVPNGNRKIRTLQKCVHLEYSSGFN